MDICEKAGAKIIASNMDSNDFFINGWMELNKGDI
jgi:hypothetical protein